MAELALKIMDNCFAGRPLRILDQSQASRNLLCTESDEGEDRGSSEKRAV